MMKRMALLRDNAGTATIELALLAPILAAMLIGMIDLSTAYSDKLKLEQVAQRSIEKVQQTGFTVAKKPTLEAEAAAAAGTGATATLSYWLECNGVKMTGASAYTNGCSSGQAYARYVELDVQKTYTPIIMSRFSGANTNGTFTLHGIAGIRIQ